MRRATTLVLVLLCFGLATWVQASEKVPVSPTTGDELPPAIVGKAGPLAGESVGYYAADQALIIRRPSEILSEPGFFALAPQVKSQVLVTQSPRTTAAIVSG